MACEGTATQKLRQIGYYLLNVSTPFGPLLLSRAFAPVLAKNGGGVIVNLLSILSWVAVPTAGKYSASKAAAWALTNWLRTGLREQGTHDLTRQVKAGLSSEAGIYLNFDPDRAVGQPSGEERGR
jgi:NAD(P)-dependent dehydrogenase (short-subunit alcohol dehydrogenase family)